MGPCYAAGVHGLSTEIAHKIPGLSGSDQVICVCGGCVPFFVNEAADALDAAAIDMGSSLRVLLAYVSPMAALLLNNSACGMSPAQLLAHRTGRAVVTPNSTKRRCAITCRWQSRQPCTHSRTEIRRGVVL